MSPLSNLAYLCIIPSYVLTRPYQHLTTKASIEPHHNTYVSLDISALIVRFGDGTHACRVDTPKSSQKWIHYLSTKVSWLFDKLSDNNTSDHGLYSTVSVASS